MWLDVLQGRAQGSAEGGWEEEGRCLGGGAKVLVITCEDETRTPDSAVSAGIRRSGNSTTDAGSASNICCNGQKVISHLQAQLHVNEDHDFLPEM